MDTKKFIDDATRTESRINTFAVNGELLTMVLNLMLSSNTILNQLAAQVHSGLELNTNVLDSAINDIDVEVATYEGLSCNGNISINSLILLPMDNEMILTFNEFTQCVDKISKIGNTLKRLITQQP